MFCLCNMYVCIYIDILYLEHIYIYMLACKDLKMFPASIIMRHWKSNSRAGCSSQISGLFGPPGKKWKQSVSVIHQKPNGLPNRANWSAVPAPVRAHDRECFCRRIHLFHRDWGARNMNKMKLESLTEGPDLGAKWDSCGTSRYYKHPGHTLFVRNQENLSWQSRTISDIRMIFANFIVGMSRTIESLTNHLLPHWSWSQLQSRSHTASQNSVCYSAPECL